MTKHFCSELSAWDFLAGLQCAGVQTGTRPVWDQRMLLWCVRW